MFWIVFSFLIGVAITVDLWTVGGVKRKLKRFNMAWSRRDGESNRRSPIDSSVSQLPFRQALLWTIVWISLAGIFAMLIFMSSGYNKSLEFITGYAIEKALSIDNMFIFLLVFSSLRIPPIYQHKILMTGVLGAVVLRIALILAGLSLLESFHWMIYVFGVLLVITGIKIFLQRRENVVNIEENIAFKIMKKFLPISSVLDGGRFFSRIDGVWYVTPIFISVIIVEMTDLVFALDSIPAVLAITTDSFIVITSNIFAILGLRSIYFLLGNMINKVYYLKAGLAAILLFVGTKMLLSNNFNIPIMASVAVIFIILSVTIILSFIRTRHTLEAKKTTNEYYL
jgi:tellurite resistance protein TerC